MTAVIPNPPLEQVLIEFAIHVGKGIGDRAVDQAAMAFWSNLYRPKIKAALAVSNWSLDRPRALTQAVKLGALAAAEAGPGKAIDAGIAKIASDAVVLDPACAAPGGGRYCV